MTTQDEIRGIIGLLRSIADIAETASLTGSLRGGTKVSVRYFNTVLKRVQGLELVAHDLFVPLDEESNMDEIGVASAHLAAYLKRMQMGPQERDTGSVDEALRKVDDTMRNLFGGRGRSAGDPADKTG
jgi:hypothetical protein